MAAPEDFKRYQNPERLDWIKDEFQKIRDELREIRRGTAARGSLHLTQEVGGVAGLNPDGTERDTPLIELEIPAGYRNGIVTGAIKAYLINGYGGTLNWYFLGIYARGMGVEQQQVPNMRIYALADDLYSTITIPFSFEVTTDGWLDHTVEISCEHYCPVTTSSAQLTLWATGFAVFQQ